MRGRFALSAVLVAAPPLGPSTPWAESTLSPNVPGPLFAEVTRALAQCGKPEQGLMVVAEQIAALRAASQPMPDAAEISQRMRRAGEPHVWPRAWAVVGQSLPMSNALNDLGAWSKSLRPDPSADVRCGVGIAHAKDGTTALVAISLDAAADLGAVPTRVRTGQWVTVDARIHVPSTSAHVVVLGPDGTPWTPPSSFDRGHLTSRFLPNRPGAYVAQVLAETTNGPRPVLEARLFADVAPTDEAFSSRAPGEEAGAGAADEADQMVRMTNGLRAHEKRASLHRDASLDSIARQHSIEMARTKTIGHDVGDGSPDARAKRAGLSPAVLGENVARGENAVAAHRSLYASISHRGNLLQPDFTRMGVGVVHDADGAVWVTELFASSK